ncbi:MAG: hypothetical protein OXD54_11570 [Candidatus Poribacteria bacterium]|nr:hypothetical protein [Candidatus Poribacteria bacterium]
MLKFFLAVNFRLHQNFTLNATGKGILGSKSQRQNKKVIARSDNLAITESTQFEDIKMVDMKTFDLPIPNMVDHLIKLMEQMEISNKERNLYDEADEGKTSMIQKLILLENYINMQFDMFLNIGSQHYQLRKNLYNGNKPTLAEISNNNNQLIDTFNNIKSKISEYEFIRMCIYPIIPAQL